MRKSHLCNNALRTILLCGVVPVMILSLFSLTTSCGRFNTVSASEKDSKTEITSSDELALQLLKVTDKAPGMVGIAVVTDNDTLTVNNGVHYPMMSVFKMHQALAVADQLSENGATLDSTLTISASEMDHDTWSPMLKVYGDKNFTISIAELLKYSVTVSDNNASNILFKRIVSPQATDNFVKTIAPDTTFRILYSEDQMKETHNLSYSNYTTPLSAALLIRKIFKEPIINASMQDSIKSYLSRVTTGTDRLGAPIADNEQVFFAHKTGSGYRNTQGELVAHNDVGYFRLPDGRDYSLAVLICDFSGTDAEASAIIADISRLVYAHFTDQ